MTAIAEAFVTLRPDTSKFQAEANRGVGSTLGSVAKLAGGIVLGGGLLQLPGLLTGSANAASDLYETISKSNTIFGDNAGVIEKWAEGGARAFGQSKQQALDNAASFGNMFTQLGIGVGQAGKMSTAMVELASDFASFHNADISEVLIAQQAAFRGEYDAVQRFVPTINAAAVEQKAMAMHLAGSTKELTAQHKALATQALLLEGAGAAMGDFARTADGAANKGRIQAAVWDDLSAKIGGKLLPVKVAFADLMLNRVFPALEKVGGALWPMVEGILATASALGERLLPPLQTVFEFFATHQEFVVGFGVAVAAVLVPAFIAWAVAAGSAAVATIIAAAPVIAITLAIAALVGGIIWAIRHWDDIKAAVGRFVDYLVGTVTGVITGIGDTVRTVVETVLGWFSFLYDHSTTIQNIVDFISGAWNMLRDATAAIWAEVSGAVGAALGMIRDAVAWYLERVIGFWGGLGGRILGALGNIGGLLYGLGVALVQGLWDGVQSRFNAFMGFLGGIADAIKDVFANALGWHSPARVFVDLGHDIMAGLRIGLQGAFPGVERTLGGMALALPGALPGPGSRASSAGGGVTVIEIAIGGRVVENLVIEGIVTGVRRGDLNGDVLLR